MSMVEAGIRVTLNRDKDGVSVNIKTNKMVADFMRSLGTGDKKAAFKWGNKWLHPNHNEGEMLMVWDGSSTVLQEMGTSVRYRLDSVGKPLVFPSEVYGGVEVINLAILRIVGADDPHGVNFLLKGFVSSTDALMDLRSKIIQAGKQLYVDFIRPCSISGVVAPASSQEDLF